MKKTISILLSLSLICSLCPIAFAIDGYDPEILAILPPTAEYAKISNQVEEDLTDLSNAYIEENLCTPISISQDGLIRYNITYPNGIVNQVTIEKNAEGCVVLNLYEDNLHNEVVILKTGDLLVDGQFVNIQNNGTITRRMRNVDYSLSPWGNASEYSIYCETYSNNAFSWGVETLVGLTTTTVAAILCGAINASIPASIGISIFAGIAADMITNCEVYGMEDAYFSWQFDVYERVGSMSIDSYYQHTGYCYSQRNLGGHAFPHTYYYHNWFS